MHIVELSIAVVEVDTKVTYASLTQNQCLQCLTPPLTHVEIPWPRDATELNNDGMNKLGDIHYQTEPNLSIFLKEISSTTSRQLQFMFAYSFSNWLAESCFPFEKPLLNVRLCL